MKKPNTHTANDDAIACFCSRAATATELVEQLKAHLDDRLGTAPEQVTWGDAATLGHLIGQLTEACRFLNIQPANA